MRRWRPGMHAIWPAPQMIPPIAWLRADQIASVLNRCGYSTGFKAVPVVCDPVLGAGPAARIRRHRFNRY
jgi:hypothetical protein